MIKHPRDPDSTRRRILDAGAMEFGAHGYAGGRIDRIAAAAQVNKRMLYHYFGDKLALHRAVLEDLLPAPESPWNLPLPTRAARLLIWGLLEPETVGSIRARWRLDERLASGNAGRLLLGSLVAGLLSPGAPPRKPRIRLSHASRDQRRPDRG